MNGKLTINRSFHVKVRRNGSKRLEDGPAVVKPTGRIPRITRLLALADAAVIWFATGSSSTSRN